MTRQKILWHLRLLFWIEGIWNLGDCQWFRRWYGGTWAYCWVEVTHSHIWLENFDCENHPWCEHPIVVEEWPERVRPAW